MPKPTKDSRPSPKEVEKNFRAELEARLAAIRQPQKEAYFGLPVEYSDLLQPGKRMTMDEADADLHNPTRSMPMSKVEEIAPQVKEAFKILAEWNRPKGGAQALDEIIAPASQFKPEELKVYGQVDVPYTVSGAYAPESDPFNVRLQGKTALGLFSGGKDKESFYEAMKTLGHEGSHFYQNRYANHPEVQEAARAFALPQAELNKKVLSKEYSMSGMHQTKDGDFQVTNAKEYMGNVFGALMKDLIKAQDENAQQRALGLRPH